MSDQNPLVSVCCLSYNHEKFIRQCLDGFVMQQTNFPIEVWVHDDASTDKSAEIIKEYAAKYPYIKPILQIENQYSKGGGILAKYVFPKCTGKYIALCEGDDYWTDPNKLQRQVDFLESHPEFKFCCHRFNIYNQENGQYQSEYATKYYGETEDLVITKNLFLKTWVTQMLTTVIRTDIYTTTAQEAIRKYGSTRDIFIFYELLCQGNGISLNANMGIYRWHPGGVSIGQDWKTRYQVQYSNLKKIFDCHPYDADLRNRVFYQWNHLLRFSNIWDKQAWTTYVAFRSQINITQRITALVNFMVPSQLSTLASDLYKKMLNSKKHVSV